jgi:hypothetical protein
MPQLPYVDADFARVSQSRSTAFRMATQFGDKLPASRNDTLIAAQAPL